MIEYWRAFFSFFFFVRLKSVEFIMAEANFVTNLDCRAIFAIFFNFQFDLELLQ